MLGLKIIENRNHLEKYILGCIITLGKYNPPGWLKSEHFADTLHQRIFSLYKSKKSKKERAEINSIRKQYKDEFKEDKTMYFVELMNSTDKYNYGIEDALNELRQYFIKAKVLEIAVTSIGQKDQGGYVKTKLEEALESCQITKERSLEDAIIENINESEARIKAVREGKQIDGIVTTGIMEIDKITGGFFPGETVVIAGATSMGKTAFACKLAGHNMKSNPVLYLTIEMSDKQLLGRMACQIGEVESRKVRNGTLQDNEYERYIKAMGEISKADLTFDRLGSIHDLSDSIRIWRRHSRMSKTGIVLIDYVQQVSNPQRGRTRDQEIQEISKLIKTIAQDENIVAFPFAQLSRSVDRRGGDKRPMLSDLRESGTLEQDADFVCFLYRPEYYGFETDDEGNSTKGLAEFMIKKHRHGFTASAKMQFVGKYGKFQDWSYETLGIPNANMISVPNASAAAWKTYSYDEPDF